MVHVRPESEPPDAKKIAVSVEKWKKDG